MASSDRPADPPADPPDGRADPPADRAKNRARNRAKEIAKTLAPWIVALGVTAFIIVRFDMRAVAGHMRSGPWGAVAPFAIALPFLYLFLHAIWDRVVFSRALGGPRYGELLRGRAGTALLMLVGYFWGHGMFGIWAARKTGAGARKVSGAVVYTMLSDLAALGFVATAATWVGGADVAPSAKRVALIVALVPTTLAVLGPLLLGKTTRAFLEPWRAVPSRLALLQIAGRALDVALAVFLMWQAARAFGLPIPALVFATYMPVVLFATSLPFNVAGLGAGQAAWLVFLPWVDAEHLLAFQLLWQIFFAFGILTRGAPFVGKVARDVRGVTA